MGEYFYTNVRTLAESQSEPVKVEQNHLFIVMEITLMSGAIFLLINN